MRRKTVSGIMLSLLLIGMLALAFNIQQVKAQEEGLIAYYPFNGNANDESGNNHNGTVYGATVAIDRFGNPNSAYSFDGIDDYVEIPHGADFDFGTGGFTVSAWIKTNATTTSGSGRDEILSKGDATISGFAISMENNKAALWVGPSGEFFGSSVLNDGEWHQIVGTRNDSGHVVLYVDGMIESTGINNQNVNTTYSVFIGKHGTTSESYFDGLIDDVRIYNQSVPPRGVFLSPSSQVGHDMRGATVSYTLQLINRIGSNDSFDLSVSGNAWPTNLSISNTGTIADGASVNFTAEVEIPALVSPGDTDTATITVTSVSEPTITDTATVTTSFMLFTDVAPFAGVDDPGGGAGIAWGDYNNDGHLDLFVVNRDSPYPWPNVLFMNRGNGTFADVTVEAGIAPDGHHGAAWGDYDNDGYLDLYVVDIFSRNFLYRNNGNGIFDDVTFEAGVGDTGDGRLGAWVDFNNDGSLDLYVTNYGTNVLYRNNGDGTFMNIAEEAGVAYSGPSSGQAWGDFDNDGYADVFLTVGNQPSLLYHNNGDETFTEVSSIAGVAAPTAGWSAPVWGDYNNDGYLDLYVANDGTNILYRNNGDGTFTDVTVEAGVGDAGNGVGAVFGDYNNDGYLDIYISNDGDPNVLYRNNRDGTFTDVSSSAGVNHTGNGQGTAFGDYDNDGDLDIYVVVRDDANVLYRNGGNSDNWLHIKTVGILSNRGGIGARVRVTNGTLSQIREVSGGSGSFGSQDSLPVEFGFGTYTGLVIVEVNWPSGIVQRLTDVATNQVITVTERPHQHDLAVTLEAPVFLKPGDSSLLNATVYNRGLSNETNVELFLLINGSEVESVVIPELLTGSSYTLSYMWSHMIEATYNVTAYTPPVPDENVTNNNWDTEFTIVRYAVMIGIIETHGESLHTEELANYYTSLGHIVEKVTTTITPEVLSSYDIVIVGEGGGTWLPSEIAAVQAYIDSGRSFVAIGDQLGTSVQEILGTYGIGYTGISAPGGSSSYFDSLHPVMQGVSLIYAGAPVNSLQITSPTYWIANDVSDTYILIAGAEVGGYLLCLSNDFAIYLYDNDNEVMFKNIVDWMTVKYEHELTVSLDAPSFLNPGYSSLLNATVRNRGLSNETSVELQLLINDTVVDSVISELLAGSSYTLSHLWTPTVEGVYNLTAYTLPLVGENVTINNRYTKFARVRYGDNMWKKYLKTGVYEDPDTYIPTPQDFGEYVGLVADSSTLIPATYGDEWSIFGLRTWVYVSDPKDISIGIVGDDGVGLYLDGNFVCGRGNAEDPMSYGTIVLSAGWHKIEALVYTGPTMYELEFDKKISDYVDVMNSERPRIIPGDVNSDGIVDLVDVVIAALAFGSTVAEPNIVGNPYDPRADLNNDGIIDIIDLVIIGVNYGKTE